MKKLKILLIFTILTLFLIPASFCYTGTYTNSSGNEITINISDNVLENYNCYIIEVTNKGNSNFSQGDYLLIFSESPILVRYVSNYYTLSTSDSKDIYYIITTLSENIVDFSNVNLENSTIYTGNPRFIFNYIFSNFDIYNTDNELVFEKNYIQEEEPTPPEEPGEEETEIIILKSIEKSVNLISFLFTIIFLQTFLNNCFKRRE